MTRNRAERRSCNYHRSYASISRDADIVANFERVSLRAALLLGVAFGLMFFVGLL